MKIRLEYEGKKDLNKFYIDIPSIKINKPKKIKENMLFYGENTIILKSLIEDFDLRGKIDLIYIDPPFATNNIFTFSEGRSNTISNSKEDEIAYKDTLKEEKFIEFIRERVFLLHQLLSDNGSLYLHIDYKIGHYVKLVLDEVFGEQNFRNDICRIKCNPKNFKRKGYGNIKDLVLFYSKSDKLIWNEPKAPYTEKDIEKLFPKVDDKGRRYTTIPLHAPGETKNGNSSKPFNGIAPPKGRHWRSDVKVLEEWNILGLIEWSSKGNPRKIIYSDEQEGKRIQDIWEYKDPQYPKYPTEKNIDMLDLIIKTSSIENSIVLDCFSGSGTTLISSIRNQRRYIGIDKSKEAIRVIRKRIEEEMNENLFKVKVDYDFYDLSDTLIE
jgi:adenine-specific DNA-methyltransferase